MKITKSQLKLIVKEELERVLEGEYDGTPHGGDQKAEFMELAHNVYREGGQTMPEDVESALQGLDTTIIAKTIFDVIMATKYYPRERIEARGGIDNLFRVVLKL